MRRTARLRVCSPSATILDRLSLTNEVTDRRGLHAFENLSAGAVEAAVVSDLAFQHPVHVRVAIARRRDPAPAGVAADERFLHRVLSVLPLASEEHRRADELGVAGDDERHEVVVWSHRRPSPNVSLLYWTTSAWAS